MLLAEAEAFPADGSHKWLTAAILPCTLQKLHLRKCMKWFRTDLTAESRQQMALGCSAAGGSTNGNHLPLQSHQPGSWAPRALDSFISHYVHSCWKMWPALCEDKSPSLVLFPWTWPRRSKTVSIMAAVQVVECSLPLISRSTCICPDCGCLVVCPLTAEFSMTQRSFLLAWNSSGAVQLSAHVHGGMLNVKVF